MMFSEKQKKIVCIVMAVAMISTVVASILLSIL